ncbi:MAG: hypothetical protein COA58_09215 [Bacteroidetes bacterium]|nr:MAG: hypothetical protein COA58_09215 [Bacteroidota bacterium]
MKFTIISVFIFVLLLSCTSKNDSDSSNDKGFSHIITKEKKSLKDMYSDSAYTVYYCWADWCGPCISSMKSTLAKTKATTDSLGIPIRYNTILYSMKVSESDLKLTQNAYAQGIEVYHSFSPNALTQKLGINSDFKPFKGFEKAFSVPRIILVNKEGKLLTDKFLLNYNQDFFINSLKSYFPEHIKEEGSIPEK